jgi:hypothetical protein
MLEIIINTPISLDGITIETTELIRNNVDVNKIAKSLGEAWVFQNEIQRIQAIYNIFKLSILSKKWIIIMKHRSKMKRLAQIFFYPVNVKLNLGTLLKIKNINVIYGKWEFISVKSFSYRFIPKINPLALKGSKLMRKFLAFKFLFIPMLFIMVCSLSGFYNNISAKVINTSVSLSINLAHPLNLIRFYHQYILYKLFEWFIYTNGNILHKFLDLIHPYIIAPFVLLVKTLRRLFRMWHIRVSNNLLTPSGNSRSIHFFGRLLNVLRFRIDIRLHIGPNVRLYAQNTMNIYFQINQLYSDLYNYYHTILRPFFMFNFGSNNIQFINRLLAPFSNIMETMRVAFSDLWAHTLNLNLHDTTNFIYIDYIGITAFDNVMRNIIPNYDYVDSSLLMRTEYFSRILSEIEFWDFFYLTGIYLNMFFQDLSILSYFFI